MDESFAIEGERLLALIFVLNSEGFRINNLFQLPGTLQWQANLTDGKKLWEFGHGETPSLALRAAWVAAKETQGTIGLEPSHKRASEASPLPVREKSSAKQRILDLDLDL